MDHHDVVIIGGGAAGLSAALVLARARRRVLVIDSGAPRNSPAAHMHGFLSRDGMRPGDLLAIARSEVEGYGGLVLHATVDVIAADEPRDDGACSRRSFTVRLGSGAKVRARRVLVSTGLRDKKLGVLWNGPATPDYAQIVRQWSDDVVLFTPAGSLTPSQRTALRSRDIGIVDAPVRGLVVHDDALCAVELAGGRLVPRDALFVQPTITAHSTLLIRLGCATDEAGWVTTGMHGVTSVAGVWAAGNVANPRAQVITAAGEGSAAAIAINADLVVEDVDIAVRSIPRLV